VTLAQFKMTSSDDPVVVYDVMREAANQLIATHLRAVKDGGLSDPAIQAVRAVRAELRTIGSADIPAQKAMTARLEASRKRLSGVARPTAVTENGAQKAWGEAGW